jgi:hypothetical protein
MSGNRSRGTRQRRQKSANNQSPTNQHLTAIHGALKDLLISTQNKTQPSIPDILPMKRSTRPKVHTFQVKVNKGYVTSDTGGDSGAFSFSLADTPVPTDYTSLFDQYRIQQVMVEFLPAVLPFTASTTALDLPFMITAIDHDDSTAAPVTTLQQYGNAQVIANQTYHQRTLTPRFSLSAYSGVFGSFSLAPIGSWIDSASPSVLYYGLKWATSPLTSVGTDILYNVVCTYTIQCRNSI